MFVPENLRKAAETYEERNKLYGDNYKRFGQIMTALFPDGILLKTIEDHNRFGVFVQIVSKITRYAEQFIGGRHADSLLDTSVYSMMLMELDSLSLQKPPPSDVVWVSPNGYTWKRLEDWDTVTRWEHNRELPPGLEPVGMEGARAINELSTSAKVSDKRIVWGTNDGIQWERIDDFDGKEYELRILKPIGEVPKSSDAAGFCFKGRDHNV